MKIFVLVSLLANIVFANVIFVEPIAGQPVISRAMLSARAGDTIMLADGRYQEEVVVANGVVLIAQNIFGAQIIGDGRNPVVRLGINSTISGLVITRGRNGVVSSNNGSAIENCWIHSNQGSGILALNRLPRITNSIISNNLSSGIQATNIGSTEGELRNLTIAGNRKNGIHIDGDQKIVLKDCIFYRNGNRAVIMSNVDLLVMENLLIFPVQREFVNHQDFFKRPRFANKFSELSDNSPGRKSASNGRDIGFNK